MSIHHVQFSVKWKHPSPNYETRWELSKRYVVECNGSDWRSCWQPTVVSLNSLPLGHNWAYLYFWNNCHLIADFANTFWAGFGVPCTQSMQCTRTQKCIQGERVMSTLNTKSWERKKAFSDIHFWSIFIGNLVKFLSHSLSVSVKLCFFASSIGLQAAPDTYMEVDGEESVTLTSEPVLYHGCSLSNQLRGHD